MSKITITITKKTPVHITFQVFVNGGLSGSLILRNEEFDDFTERVKPEKIRDNVEAVQSYKEMGEGLERLHNPIQKIYEDNNIKR